MKPTHKKALFDITKNDAYNVQWIKEVVQTKLVTLKNIEALRVCIECAQLDENHLLFTDRCAPSVHTPDDIVIAEQKKVKD